MSFARALAAQPDFHIDFGDTFMTDQRYYFGLISQRKRCFHNPRPDGFYSGNAAQDPVDGLLENYYAWEWGVTACSSWPTFLADNQTRRRHLSTGSAPRQSEVRQYSQRHRNGQVGHTYAIVK